MTEEHHYIVPTPYEVAIKDIRLGGSHPVVIQTMANTDTANVAESVQQLLKIEKSGAQLVRFTTQGLKEVESLHEIIAEIRKLNIGLPVVADVHFNAKVAFAAAQICDKVRINPGNFTEKRRNKTSYTEEEYNEAFDENSTRLRSLIAICKEHQTALRIGVNHGSLSDRIVARYGDTPEGMVASALEFIRICHEEQFHNIVVSLKSSNTRLMVQSVRLLVHRMTNEDLYYPIHLGVTESGDGLEGRIKSVAGIAPLLMEGIGDTIRVSLTEPPEDELPVANTIRKLFPKPTELPYHPFEELPWDPFRFEKLIVHEVNHVGGNNPPVVISQKDIYSDPEPDIQVTSENGYRKLMASNASYILSDLPFNSARETTFYEADITFSAKQIASITGSFIIVLNAADSPMTDVKRWLIDYRGSQGFNPVILYKRYSEKNRERYTIQASGEFGLLLIDGLLSGIWIENPFMPNSFNNWFSFYLLQATRNRTTTVEYIACPSCGRTQFNIQSVLKEVREKTSHLKGLKIAVMGCIVNGPGEMADADYGYIGAGKGLVSIYKGRIALLKNIPEKDAVNSLIEVIKENNDWVEP